MRAYLKQRKRDILSGGGGNILERRRFNFLLSQYRENKQQIYGGMKRIRPGDDGKKRKSKKQKKTNSSSSSTPAEITRELYKDTIFNFVSWEEVEQERISEALKKKLGSGAALTGKLGIGSSGTIYTMKNGNVVKIVLESYLPQNFNTFYFQFNEDDVELAKKIGEQNLGPKVFEHGALYLEYEKGEEKKLNKKNSEYFARTGDHAPCDAILHKDGIKFWYMVMERLYDTDAASKNREYKEKREDITREILKREPRASDFEFGFIKQVYNISDLRAFDLLIGDIPIGK